MALLKSSTTSITYLTTLLLALLIMSSTSPCCQAGNGRSLLTLHHFSINQTKEPTSLLDSNYTAFAGHSRPQGSSPQCFPDDHILRMNKQCISICQSKGFKTAKAFCFKRRGDRRYPWQCCCPQQAV